MRIPARLSAAALAALLAAAAAAEREGRITVERSMGRSRPAAPQGSPAPRGQAPGVVIKMRQVQVPAPSRPQPSAHVERDLRPIAPPSRDASGAPVRQRPTTSPPAAHTGVVRNQAVVRSIEHDRRVEVVPRQYMWHHAGGVRYCHYFDGRAHWYGFYHGPRFYWTRYYGDFWWWYDPVFFRWVYWSNGNWWWPGPAGVAYVYVGNNYYPYEDDSGAVTVKSPQMDQPPPPAPAAQEGGRSWKSADGSRMVQVTGPQDEAFLYDTSRGDPSFLAYLARGVETARFSGREGRPPQVLLDFKDGSFALYDADGRAVDAKSSTPARPTAPSGPATPPPAPPGE